MFNDKNQTYPFKGSPVYPVASYATWISRSNRFGNRNRNICWILSINGFSNVNCNFFATFMYANRPAAMAAVWITNPFTFLPIYIFTYKVGKYLLPGPEERDAHQIINKIAHKLIALDFWEIYHQFRIMNTLGRKIFVHLLLGGIIVGCIAGGASYFLTVRIVKTYRKAKLKK